MIVLFIHLAYNLPLCQTLSYYLSLLQFQNKNILQGAGSISKGQMEAKVRDIYEEFDDRRKKYDALHADNLDIKEIEEMKEIERKLKERNK